MNSEASHEYPPNYRHQIIERTINGLADGSLILNPKSPHKGLNGSLGEIYDQFTRDIDLYNMHEDLFGIVSMRLFGTIVRLRAYGLISEVNPASKFENQIAKQSEAIDTNNNLLREVTILLRQLFRKVEKSDSS